MIPVPDWNRLRPRTLPPSTLRGGGGCSDFSGCLLGCGGTLAVVILALNIAKAYGLWAGLGALIVLIVLAELLAKAPRIIPGLLLGALAAAGVWLFMKRDSFNQPGWMATGALLAFLLFSAAGYWDQKRRA